MTQDRPIKRRGTAVADDAGVDDETGMVLPDRCRYGPFKERCNDEIGGCWQITLYRTNGDRIIDIEFDRDLMPTLAQLYKQTLTKAIKGVAEKEDAHQWGWRLTDTRQLFTGQPIHDSAPPKTGLHLYKTVGVFTHLADDGGLFTQWVRLHGLQ